MEVFENVFDDIELVDIKDDIKKTETHEMFFYMSIQRYDKSCYASFDVLNELRINNVIYKIEQIINNIDMKHSFIEDVEVDSSYHKYYTVKSDEYQDIIFDSEHNIDWKNMCNDIWRDVYINVNNYMFVFKIDIMFDHLTLRDYMIFVKEMKQGLEMIKNFHISFGYDEYFRIYSNS